MPCNSEYLRSTSEETSFSRIACLLDELDGKPINPDHWSGYHPDVYSKHLSNEKKDRMVKTLCEAIQTRDVSKLSLEMQIWWRDHQIADRERLEKEIQEQQTDAEKKKALAKLTDYEKQLLGIDI